MKINSSKKIIWKNSTALKILIYFMETPTEEFYGSEISKDTGISVGAVNKYLTKLCEEGFLKKKKKGRMIFYSLKRESKVIKHLKIAYNLSKEVVGTIKAIGERLNVEIFIYGSVARGEDKKSSDWDFLIIGDISSSKLQKELGDIETDINIKPSIYTRKEWIEMEEKDPAFYERVERDKIRLV